MITYDEQEVIAWLNGLAEGRLDLDENNSGLAQAALGLLQPVLAPPSDLPAGQLSPHFTLAEFVYSDTAQAQGIDNTPSDEVVAHLTELANMMEDVRAICGGHPVIISSGYRCPALNKAIGGAADSAHLYGCACDFTIPAFGTPHQIWLDLQPLVAALGIDQLISESGGGAAWVHIGRTIPPNTTPRHQCFEVCNPV